ncbi:MAG: hypothetical protein J3Q66DRAFT_409039 [Benniella sp.]|nr:MAG: hypothetical protein J3Q66DRAFT_409039 [Benniella sp.]
MNSRAEGHSWSRYARSEAHQPVRNGNAIRGFQADLAVNIRTSLREHSGRLPILLEKKHRHDTHNRLTVCPIVRLCKDLGAPLKNRDLIIKHRNTVDLGFGEVSFTASYGKDQGDLRRLAIWAERALDQLQTQFEGLQDLDLFFPQIISTHCTIYQMCKVGTICIVFQMRELDVAHHLGNLLSLQDQLPIWMGFEQSFGKLLDRMTNCSRGGNVQCYTVLSWNIYIL